MSRKPVDREMALDVLTGAFTTETYPWSTKREDTIESGIVALVKQLAARQRLELQIDHSHYGSGYASYVDCWLYRDVPELRVSRYGDGWTAFDGLVVLISRHAPLFALGSGEKAWRPRGSSGAIGGSYQLHLDDLDRFPRDGVRALVAPVSESLERSGLARVHREELEPFLEADVDIFTVLGSRPYRIFDALFHWED